MPPLPDEHIENDGTPKVKPTGKRTPLTPEKIRELARVDAGTVTRAIQRFAKDNPALLALLIAVPTDEGRE